MRQGASEKQLISCPLSRSFAQSPRAGKVKSFLSLRNPQKPPSANKLFHTCINTKLAKPMEKNFAFWQQSWLNAHHGLYPKPTGAEGTCTDFSRLWIGSGWEESACLHPLGMFISSFCSVVSPNKRCCNRYQDLHQCK